MNSQHNAVFERLSISFSLAIFIVFAFLSVPALAAERVESLDKTTVEVFFLDIGQGDAILVQTADKKTLLVDTGPPKARKALQNRLAHLGVTSLDGLVITHAHADHMGNAVDLLKTMEVKTILDSGFNHSTQTYLKFLQQVEQHKNTSKLRYIKPRDGFTFPVGQFLSVEVLGPSEPLLQGTRSDPNSNSVILKLVAGETSLLLTGDAEHETEVQLLQKPESKLRADVLKVAHHGSKYASGNEFLERVGAKEAVISCSKNNNYGHPAPETLQRLKAHNMEYWVTAEVGDIALKTDGKEYTLGPAHFQIAQATTSPYSPPAGVAIAQTTQIDLNRATEGELTTLKGIGPAKARAIINYRQQNGAFKTIDELQSVKGIGAKTVQKLRPFLKLGTSMDTAPATAEPIQEAPEQKEASLAPVETNQKGLPLNSATREQLMSLPGIGPSKAGKILDYRNSKPNGFDSIDELTSVKGIGKKTLEKLRPLLRLNL